MVELQKNMIAAVIGSGSWATALAMVLAENYQQVYLVVRSGEKVTEINQQHTNQHYLPDVTLSQKIVATESWQDIAESVLIVVAVPSSVTREIAQVMHKQQVVQPNTIILSCAKGIEFATQQTMSQILAEFFPSNVIAALGGPSHAEEVASKTISCGIIGCSDDKAAVYLQQTVSTTFFRLYRSEDILGVELGGALKNIFSLASGMAQGIGLGYNAIAALTTRSLAEMIRLGEELGGKKDTFYGLAGIGDLMVTCFSPLSRNYQAGKKMGQGLSREQVVAALGMVVEGIPNTKSVYQITQNMGIDTPIIDAVYEVLYCNQSVAKALNNLLARDLKPE